MLEIGPRTCPVCEYPIEPSDVIRACPECGFLYDHNTIVLRSNRRIKQAVIADLIVLGMIVLLAAPAVHLTSLLLGARIAGLAVAIVCLMLLAGTPVFILFANRGKRFAAITPAGIGLQNYQPYQLTAWDDFRKVVPNDWPPSVRTKSDKSYSLSGLGDSKEEFNQFAAFATELQSLYGQLRLGDAAPKKQHLTNFEKKTLGLSRPKAMIRLGCVLFAATIFSAILVLALWEDNEGLLAIPMILAYPGIALILVGLWKSDATRKKTK